MLYRFSLQNILTKYTNTVTNIIYTLTNIKILDNLNAVNTLDVLVRVDAMDCQFCEEKPELISIVELTGELPHTFDFDKDGKLFKVCPSCLTVDNIGLRIERDLVKKAETHTYSHKDKEVIVYIICNLKKLKGEERKTTVASVMKQIQHESDERVVSYLSSFFNFYESKVEILFHNVKIYRKEKVIFRKNK